MLHLIRHGETAWSRAGRHTGRSDPPLLPVGDQHARALGQALHGREFAQVWTSPLQRARRTCELAGFGGQAIVDAKLSEWDYGRYDGRTLPEITTERPGWNIFQDGAPEGESVAAARARAEAFLAQCEPLDREILIFSSGHFLRLLTTVWLGLDPLMASHLPLGTGSWSTLDIDARHDLRVIRLWNYQPGTGHGGSGDLEEAGTQADGRARS